MHASGTCRKAGAQTCCHLQEVKARRAEVKKYSTDPVYKKKIDDERRKKKEAEVNITALIAQATSAQNPSMQPVQQQLHVVWAQTSNQMVK